MTVVVSDFCCTFVRSLTFASIVYNSSMRVYYIKSKANVLAPAENALKYTIARAIAVHPSGEVMQLINAEKISAKNSQPLQPLRAQLAAQKREKLKGQKGFTIATKAML